MKVKKIDLSNFAVFPKNFWRWQRRTILTCKKYIFIVHIQYTQCAQTVHKKHRLRYTRIRAEITQVPTESCLGRVIIVKCKPNRSDLN
jgi:hypothetical protein